MRTGVWSAVLSAAVIAVAGSIGIALKQPWVFPSLGPTLMVLAETPHQPASRPQNVLVGHLVGIGAGLLGLVVMSLRNHPNAVQEGLHTDRVVACCIAVAVTALVLNLVRLPHPPAGATTLIVALGILQTSAQLRTMVFAVLLVAAVAAALSLVRRGTAVSEKAPSCVTGHRRAGARGA